MSKLALGLPLSVLQIGPGSFIKSVELVLDDEVVGEIYVHPARWDNRLDERAARREARAVLKRMLAP